MTSRALFFAAATGLAATLSPVAHGAITLQNGQQALLADILGPNNPDHTVNIGDKTFVFQTYTSAHFPTSAVSISAFIAANPLDGIGFDITGGFGDTSAGDAIIAEFNLLYTVEVNPTFLAQGYRLKDIGLAFNGAASGAGSYARVDESVFDASGLNLLSTLHANVTAGSSNIQQDFRDFSPSVYTKFQVNKDVKFFAVAAGNTATASFVRQTFSQTIIPAPGAAALVGMGGLLAVRRRRA
jgi:uncharacterized protein (TIGR03382 family)